MATIIEITVDSDLYALFGDRETASDMESWINYAQTFVSSRHPGAEIKVTSGRRRRVRAWDDDSEEECPDLAQEVSADVEDAWFEWRHQQRQRGGVKHGEPYWERL